MNEIVPLQQLAAELGVARSNARRIAKRLGYEPERRQLLELGHHQRTLCWSREAVEAIKAARKADGFEVPA